MPRCIVVVALAACGRFGFDSRDDAAGDVRAGPSDGMTGSDGTGPSGTGSGTVSGTTGVCAGFTTVGAAYVMGQAPAGQTSMALLSTAAPCSALTAQGWPGSLPAGSVTLSLLVGATATGSYAIPSCAVPNVGQACSNCYRDGSVDGGMTGTVQLTALRGDGSATGTYTVQFFDGTLTGMFDAVACPQGRGL